jgi:DNA-binding LacI/PurR family transcriptional regulator
MKEDKKPTSLGRPITLKDVAKLAGVAPSTISRALNHPEMVSEKTLQKIMPCIKALGYRPNFLASGLQTSISRIIALVVPSISNLAFANLAHGVQKGLESTSYGLIIASSEEDKKKEEEICNLLTQHWVDGVIFASSTGGIPPLELLPKETAIALIDRESNLAHIDSFVLDLEAGIKSVCDHLLALGHKKIAIIAGDPSTITGQNRLLAFKNCLERAGLELPEAYIETGYWSSKGGWESMLRLLNLPQPPTAVFAVTDTMAMGAVGAAEYAGFRVPEDISIVGFNNEPGSAEFNPPLTTLDASSFSMGKEAAHTVLKRIAHPELPANKVTYPLQLIIRNSTTLPRMLRKVK